MNQTESKHLMIYDKVYLKSFDSLGWRLQEYGARTMIKFESVVQKPIKWIQWMDHNLVKMIEQDKLPFRYSHTRLRPLKRNQNQGVRSSRRKEQQHKHHRRDSNGTNVSKDNPLGKFNHDLLKDATKKLKKSSTQRGSVTRSKNSYSLFSAGFQLNASILKESRSRLKQTNASKRGDTTREVCDGPLRISPAMLLSQKNQLKNNLGIKIEQRTSTTTTTSNRMLISAEMLAQTKMKLNKAPELKIMKRGAFGVTPGLLIRKKKQLKKIAEDELGLSSDMTSTKRAAFGLTADLLIRSRRSLRNTSCLTSNTRSTCAFGLSQALLLKTKKTLKGRNISGSKSTARKLESESGVGPFGFSPLQLKTKRYGLKKSSKVHKETSESGTNSPSSKRIQFARSSLKKTPLKRSGGEMKSQTLVNNIQFANTRSDISYKLAVNKIERNSDVIPAEVLNVDKRSKLKRPAERRRLTRK